MPREPGSPASGIFRLAVVTIKNESSARQVDPVVYVAGGPGWPLTARTALIAEREAAVVAPDRDLILVDQRGVGRSEPLLCPDLADQQLAIFAAGPDQSALLAAWRRSYAICRVQMVDDGIRPEWFGSRITAQDFESVRQALGVVRWTVYALSYGTTVALTIMALHPESLRAVVLDSVYPPDPLPMTPPQTFGRALDQVFEACRADPACAAAHPDLARAYAEAQATLDATPLTVTPPPGLGLPAFTLRAETFRLIVDRLLYSRLGQALVPSFIEGARRRDALALRPAVGRVVLTYRTQSLGAVAAVECQERPSWRVPARADDAPVSAFVPGMCETWPPLGPAPLMPLDAAVPALLLAGRNDPVTPPDFARLAAATLGLKAKVVELANVGHGAAQASPCGEALVTAFVRDPAGALDSACADHVPPVGFR